MVSFGRNSLQSVPRRYHRTKGDGNCFFRAISYILAGNEELHTVFRDAVVKHMRVLSNKMENYLQKNISRYLNDSGMCMDGVLATDAEILGAASLLGTDIVVYSHFGSQMTAFSMSPILFGYNSFSR